MGVICDSCGAEFDIRPRTRRCIRGFKGVEETYFTCPTCQTRYTVFYTDEKIRELQKIARKKRSHEAIKKAQTEIRQLMDELKAEVERSQL